MKKKANHIVKQPFVTQAAICVIYSKLTFDKK